MQATALQLILQAGVFVKCILLLLACFSVMSWGIILYKYFYLKTAARETAVFLAAFAEAGNRSDVLKAAEPLTISPIARLFKSVSPVQRQLKGEAVDLVLRRSEAVEAERLESYLIMLATTGATAPFIGLLGTVWGIMDAFRGIGAAGSASLVVVAPAIAEALIATAAGLAAAIPAVMAYNYFLNWTRKMTLELEDFAAHLRAQPARAGHEG